MRLTFYIVGLLALLYQPCVAQLTDSSRTLHGQLDMGGWVTDGPVMPFWLQTNQYGTVPKIAPGATFRTALQRDYARPDTLRRRRAWFDWSFGLSGVVNAGRHTQVLLPEAYVAFKLGPLELLAGRRRQLYGLGDSTLSSGFIGQSDNALPIPKIQLATRGYVPLGFLRNSLAINAGYNHGWFNVPYIQESYLHQKYVYVRFGKPTAKFTGFFGLNHQVQFGGTADYLRQNPKIAVNGRLPASLKYYPYIVLAINPGEWANADYTSFDGAYRIGNHVGSVDMAFTLRTGRGNWLLYNQHIYDDVSSLLFLNLPDGLTGLRWVRSANQPVRAAVGCTRVVAEYLTTLNQTAPTFDVPNSVFQGADNYYNNGQYREGWSYLGRTLGTPFIMPGVDLRPQAQSNLFFPNNRVRAWYVGATGLLLQRITWTTRLAYSENFGVFGQPYDPPLPQFSGLISAQLPLQRWAGTQVVASLAVDQGPLRPNAVGGYVGLRRQW